MRKCDGPPKSRFINGLTNASIQSVAVRSRVSSTSSPSPAIYQKPNFTPTEETAAQLADALTHNLNGLSNSSFARILDHAPAMMETSAALTAAVNCCLGATIRRPKQSYQRETIDPVDYALALSSLKKALSHAQESLSIPTLTATAILARVDVSICPQGSRALLTLLDFNRSELQALRYGACLVCPHDWREQHFEM